MKKILQMLLFTLCLALYFVPGRALADFPERPVGFAVLDASGAVDGAAYSQWRQVVKWAYHFPYYKIMDGEKEQSQALRYLQGSVIDKDLLRLTAKECGFDVLVAAKIYELDETIVGGFGFRDDSTYVRVVADADLYVYKAEGDKLLTKKLRERGLKELALYEPPAETVKWELCRLVNTMEGRPIIH